MGDDGPPSSYCSGKSRASLFAASVQLVAGSWTLLRLHIYYMRSLIGRRKTPEFFHCIFWLDESCSLVYMATLPRPVISTLDAQLCTAFVHRAGCRACVRAELDSSTSALASVLALGSIRPLDTGATPV